MVVTLRYSIWFNPTLLSWSLIRRKQSLFINFHLFFFFVHLWFKKKIYNKKRKNSKIQGIEGFQFFIFQFFFKLYIETEILATFIQLVSWEIFLVLSVTTARQYMGWVWVVQLHHRAGAKLYLYENKFSLFLLSYFISCFSFFL